MSGSPVSFIVVVSHICASSYFNTFKYLQLKVQGLAWWLTPVIPALWEADAGGSLEARKFETSLDGNMVKPNLY